MQARLTIVVAIDAERGIGVQNQLPWHLPEDLAHFKRTTSGHPIIMGRKTFDSIGRPLPNRRNIVITRNSEWRHDSVDVVASLSEAISLVRDAEACIIGGGQIFAEALPLADRMVITEIDKTFQCDVFFPEFSLQEWQETAREHHHSDQNGFDYAFVTYQRK
jgi:dihydrofolate reductase